MLEPSVPTIPSIGIDWYDTDTSIDIGIGMPVSVLVWSPARYRYQYRYESYPSIGLVPIPGMLWGNIKGVEKNPPCLIF